MKKEYYVEWVGRVPDVYDNWNNAKAQVHGYSAPRYKGGFATRLEAEQAFRMGYEKWLAAKEKKDKGGPPLF